MISKTVLVRRQRQANNLLAGQADELRRLEQRHREGREHLEGVQAAELALVKQRHRRELAELYQAQGRQLGPWATAELERRAPRGSQG